MAVLMTGATGFIGSHIARKLKTKGDEVRALVRATSDTGDLDRAGITKINGDITDRASVLKALEGCETVYHCAGFVSFKKRDYGKMVEINVEGARNVLSAALETGVRKVVFTSSVAALGPAVKDGFITEDSETDTDFQGANIGYMNVKRAAEAAALDFCEKGLDVVITNPSVVIGAGDKYLSSVGSVLWYCKRRFPGYMDGTLNLTDVEDVAEGHILAAEKGKTGECYILSNTNLTVLEYFTLLEKVTGVPAPKLKIPYPAAYVSAFFAERVLGLAFPNYSTMDLDSVKLSRYNWHTDCSKAERELGYKRGSVEESLRKTVEWFKSRRLL
ncbi:MAG: NAD-dependent epimerase/dehydratase family protein [Candidatus Mycalebacterium zealandia]|nr:MAG: NAD-dependent epimerase/dehydratase family protein [Candidatus Mycalebacterium zealandia]